MSQASAIRPPTHPITAGAHAHLQIVFASRALAFLASARQWPSCVLGDPERGATAAGGLHAVRTGIRGHYRYLLLSLPETIGLEFRRGPGVHVLLDVIQLLRCGRGTQLRHGRGVYRLVLLADVIGYRDGGEYPDDHDNRHKFHQGKPSLVRLARFGHSPCEPAKHRLSLRSLATADLASALSARREAIFNLLRPVRPSTSDRSRVVRRTERR